MNHVLSYISGVWFDAEYIFKYWTNVLKHTKYFVPNVEADRQTQVSENFVSYFRRAAAASSSRLAVLVQLFNTTA